MNEYRLHLCSVVKDKHMGSKLERDIDKEYPKGDFVAKLRRLADAIEAGDRFEIQIAGERIYVPVRAIFTIEHEKSSEEEEIEFQIKWRRE
jgi:amphi-Trp domain-containing protein